MIRGFTGLSPLRDEVSFRKPPDGRFFLYRRYEEDEDGGCPFIMSGLL